MVQVCETYLYEENKVVWVSTDGETVQVTAINFTLYDEDDDFLDYERMTIVDYLCEELRDLTRPDAFQSLCIDCMFFFDRNLNR